MMFTAEKLVVLTFQKALRQLSDKYGLSHITFIHNMQSNRS